MNCKVRAFSGAVQQAPSSICYRGRFAPSPTGHLHLGSLIAALGSYLLARQAGGQWFVRIEDIDPPRIVPGSVSHILHSLERHGLLWDGDILYQSKRAETYEAALERLKDLDLLYSCSCSRSEIAQIARPGKLGFIYPGLCRNGPLNPQRNLALRVKVPDESIMFIDRLQGRYESNLQNDSGDFILRRSDGLYSYQLAVVLDDAFQGITEVVRGADLLDSTPRQIHLQRVLNFPTPDYVHLPILLDVNENKLSKSISSASLEGRSPSENLVQALHALGHAVPNELRGAGPEELLAWAKQSFRLENVPPVLSRKI